MTSAETVLVGSRLLLAAVFAVAGVAKLADVAGSRRALAEFGLPIGLAVPLGVVLPVLELIVAGALIPTSTARYGAVAALALLVAFIGGITTSLARGRRPECHCFGQLHRAPVGWRVLARNAILAALALFVVVAGGNDPGPSAVAWLVPLTMGQRLSVLGGALGLALMASQVALLLRIVRQNERLLSSAGIGSGGPATPDAAGTHEARHDRLPALLPVGSQAPEFALPSLDGATVTLGALRAAGKSIVLVFSDPNCVPCGGLMPRIAEWRREHGHALELVVVSRGAVAANRARVQEHGLPQVLLQRDREVALAYGIPGTPSALLVNHDGTVGSGPVSGDVEIGRLVATAAAYAPPVSRSSADRSTAPSQRMAEAPGRLAPDFTLPDLDGRAVSLSGYRGKPAVILFWNPGCGFCTRILDTVQAWDARPDAERSQLLVVSAGSIEDNRALGLNSRVVLDADQTIGRLYGVRGTPSLAFVDEEGRLAGAPVEGGPPVLAALEFATSTALSPDLVPVRLDGVEDELLSDGSMVIYNPGRQRVLTLNGTAALIWECCDGEQSVASIITEVREVFPSTPGVERDVRELVSTLRQEGLISMKAS
jgi:peroxiredoxin